MTGTPIVHRTIRKQIAAHLRNEVLSGQLREGEPVREQSLAERFGVSRGPIRDALLELSKEGVLVSRQNRGVFVRKHPDPKMISLVVALRRQVETFALDRIFHEILPADLTRWEDNLQILRTACREENLPAVVEQDMAFHRSIVARAGDDALLAIWRPIASGMMPAGFGHSRLIDIYTEHRAVYEAVRTGNKDAAVDQLTAHIR